MPRQAKKQPARDTSLVFRIAKLWGSPEGTIEKHEIDLPLTFDPKDIDTVSNFEADIMLIKLKSEISAVLSNAEVTVKFSCNRCLKPFKEKIYIESAEREYFSEEPSKYDDITDYYFIDTKAFTIDLTNMIREEIILHFPFIQVCSKSCRGLCSSCGKDRNKTVCKCKDVDADMHQPFKNLKNLYNK